MPVKALDRLHHRNTRGDGHERHAKATARFCHTHSVRFGGHNHDVAQSYSRFDRASIAVSRTYGFDPFTMLPRDFFCLPVMASRHKGNATRRGLVKASHHLRSNRPVANGYQNVLFGAAFQRAFPY